MVGTPHPPTPVGMQGPGSMLRWPKREKPSICRGRPVYRGGPFVTGTSTHTYTQRAGAALPVCCKCAHMLAELRGASHSSSRRRFDRSAAPALLPAGLADAVVAQQASRCHEPTEHLRSEHTRCSDAGGHRGAVGAHLDERRSCARSWRQPSSQVLHPPAVSIPQLSEHVCCEISAVRRSFDTGQSQSHTA